MTHTLARLDRSTTALVVIDLQHKLLPAIAETPRVIRASRLILQAARILGMPTVVTTQYQKGLGSIVPEIEELLPPDVARLDKTSFSCFDDGRFVELLRATAPMARTLLVAGVEAHICVAGTVLGALRRGYAVEVVADGVAARGSLDSTVALHRMEQAGALLATAEMAVYELLRDSSAAEFKALLPSIRA